MREAIGRPLSRWKASLSRSIQTSQRLSTTARWFVALPIFLGGVCIVYHSLTDTALPYWRHPEMSSWLRLRDSVGGVAILPIPIAYLLSERRSKLAVGLLGAGKVGLWAYIASLIAFFLFFGRLW